MSRQLTEAPEGTFCRTRACRLVEQALFRRVGDRKELADARVHEQADRPAYW